jgi:methylated-DNA-[protein]-cysteine S-methyltransferase
MSDSEIHHAIFDTAIGPCGVAWTALGLIALALPERDATETEARLRRKSGSTGAAEPPPDVASAIARIQDYCAGERVDFTSAPLDLSAVDPYRRALYDTMRGIGFGETVTYGTLAQRAGVPVRGEAWEAAREVGAAMGRNPLPLVIPCHRIVAAGGKLGGFSAYGGTTTKAKLLALEGVFPKEPAKVPRLPGL